MWPVDPLERTCTEVRAPLASDEPYPKAEKAEVMKVCDLMRIPAFVLLGEPGMGKSAAMEALAASANGEFIRANDFIVNPPPGQNQPVFIDALDEARATGDTTVWRELRRALARSKPPQFGVSCRSADWMPTDREELAFVAKPNSVRVFALDPLTPEQQQAVLQHEGVVEVDAFEQEAKALGFADMLGNPQSIKLLAHAVQGNNGKWPKTRREAYELACREQLKEPNPSYQQGRSSAPHVSDEHLMDAAGWLCALMLLGNRSEVTPNAATAVGNHTVQLINVMDALPNNAWSTTAVHEVLKRRLFVKPSGYTAIHRTVAEYLAARHIAQRIARGGLLPGRVCALMLASQQQVVGNLRGLAGWLAALSPPMRAAIFKADPYAVLDYGDLHLLLPSDKQELIAQLAEPPLLSHGAGWWQRAQLCLPLVQDDMHSFVAEWLEAFGEQVRPTEAKAELTHGLLNALERAPANPDWAPTLQKLVRAEGMAIGLRVEAVRALHTHIGRASALTQLLSDIRDGGLQDASGRLTGALLLLLYPHTIGPSEALKFLRFETAGKSIGELQLFWHSDIVRLTPSERLLTLMDAIESAVANGLFTNQSPGLTGHRHEGLATLAVRAIQQLGSLIPTSKLADWISLCAQHRRSPFEHLNRDNSESLHQWMRTNPSLLQQVLAHWVTTGNSSWMARCAIPHSCLPPDMGRFWLGQALAFLTLGEEGKAKDCIGSAFDWTSIDTGGASISEVLDVAAQSPVLESALASKRVSLLDEDNWQRDRWLNDKEYLQAKEVERALSDKDRQYLLDHLPDVRNGTLVRYLSSAAWVDLADSGYASGPASQPIAAWRAALSNLNVATLEGYQALLSQLTLEQANNAVASRRSNQQLLIELPCLLAAQHLHTQDPERFFNLGEERLKAAATLHLLNQCSNNLWFLDLAERQPDWVETVWWPLCKRAMQSKKGTVIPHLWLLKREPRTRLLTAKLLPDILAQWPTKFDEKSFGVFAEVLQAAMNECPAAQLSELLAQRLKKKSIGSLQRAYLVMAGLWIDPIAFEPLLRSLLVKKQATQSELLGFIGNLRRHGRRSEPLPGWSANVIAFLVKLFGPLCPAAYPVGTFSRGLFDDGRDFLYQLLDLLRTDATEAAQRELHKLSQDPALPEWLPTIEACATHQARTMAEQAFSLPTPRQVALTLQNSTPANPTDLMAVALYALDALQQEVRNSPTNIINRFWAVNSSGNRPQPPQRPENECRNVIADWLSNHLRPLGISVGPEHQHGAQNQSDIALEVHTLGSRSMLLPIEVKGDWHRDLWTAARDQLARKYASEARCGGHGIYLVLWLGANRGKSALKRLPNRSVRNAFEMQTLLQEKVNQAAPAQTIRVFVLDISIAE